MLLRRIAGFTLMELLVVLAIMGIAMAIAIPAVSEYNNNARMSTTTNDIILDLALARSDAARRGNYMTVCSSKNQTSCETAGNDWAVGRIVFVDIDGDGVIENGDVVVRKSPASNAAITAKASVTPMTRITYAPSGMLTRGSASMHISICAKGRTERRVIVQTGGRTQAQRTTTTCP